MSTPTEFDKELDAILQNLGKSLEIISGRELEGAIMLLSAKQAIQDLYRTREATLIREARIDLWKEVVGSINIPAYRNKAVARVLIPMYRERLRELTNQQKGEQK